MSAALKQASYLNKIVSHLEAHPHLTPVTITTPYSNKSQRLELHPETNAAHVLAWAETLGRPSNPESYQADVYVRQTATCKQYLTMIDAIGFIDDYQLVIVRGFDTGDLGELHDSREYYTLIPLDTLRSYVQRGTIHYE